MKKEACKEERFRVSAKRLFLTYSQLPQKLTPDSVISQLQEKIEFTGYVLGVEHHKDGGKHFHVVLISERKLETRNPSIFDIKFYDEVHKGHCEGIRNLSKTVSYVCKSGDYMSNLPNIYKGTLMPMEQLLRTIAREEGYIKALEYHDKINPKASMGSKSFLNLERYFRRKAELERASTFSIRQSMSTPFKITDFKEIKGIERWIQNGYQPPLILVGPPGSGKTQFVKALASLAGWYMHIVNHRESIKYLTDQHDSIFFDDMSLESLDEYTILALLETNDDRNIRVLHSSVFKRKGLVEVFALNKEVFLKMRELFERDEYARRCNIVQVPADFIINVNVVNNININNVNIHNQIYNNPETIKANKQAILDIENS